MSLKQKTVKSLIWSFIDSFASQGIQFVISIILARILSPHEFGLIGMLTIFISVSQSLVDSGFGGALIRKKVATQTDYSTVFYFNLIISIFLFLTLYLASVSISQFFNEPRLSPILKVISFSLILNAFGIIPKTILAKSLNFKLQTRVTIISSVISGIIAIIIAFKGFGVWSLVALSLSRFFFDTFFLWFLGKWRPSKVFSFKSFKEMFSFGNKLLISGLVNTISQNIYNIIIGKYFSVIELGFYTKADQFKSVPAENLNKIIGRVTFPVLSTLQDDKTGLKNAYRRLIKSVMFITLVLVLGIAATSKPLVITLIGEKWIKTAEYLHLLCFVGLFYPVNALNLNILKVLGRSDLTLRLVLFSKILIIPVIVIGIRWGIKSMIISMIISTVINYFIFSYYSGIFIDYSVKQQIVDILPSFCITFFIYLLLFTLGIFLNCSTFLVLIIQILLGAVATISICELLKLEEYLYVKQIILDLKEEWLLNHKT